MRRRYDCVVALVALCALVSIGADAPAGTIDLSLSTATPRIIAGGTANISATVRNLDDPGGTPLNFDVAYTMPSGDVTVENQTLDADGGAASNTYTRPFNTALIPDPPGGLPREIGPHDITVLVTDPEASNSPQEATVRIEELSRPRILFWFFDASDDPIDEPGIAPEQFAATGGGESFAAASAAVGGGPNSPTAGLDLDDIIESGDPQISITLSEFDSHPSSNFPEDAVHFEFRTDTSRPGTFHKTFTLLFSDEDLPGARPEASVIRTIHYTTHVVPEPAALGLYAVAAVAALHWRQRR